MMKKIIMSAIVSLALASVTSACPLWECNYGYYDYSCGCQCSNTVAAAYCNVQPIIYCQVCGNETWACTCDTYDYNIETEYEDIEEPEIYYDQDCTYNESAECSYSGSSCLCMAQWANIRNSCGVIIAQAGAGDLIEICGTEADTGRTLIYDKTIGVYGSVLSECIYGTYSWDGSGDNGYYNQYNGSNVCGSCGHVVSSCVCNCQTQTYCPYSCIY